MCAFSLLVGPRIVAFVPFLALSACFYFLSLVLGMLNLPVQINLSAWQTELIYFLGCWA